MTELPAQDPYALAGVDTAAGENYSKYAGRIARESWRNSPFVEMADFSKGRFRGPRGWRLRGLPKGCFNVASADGNGSKTVLTSLALNHPQAAADLIAMTRTDLTRHGGMGLIFLNVLDVETLGKENSETNHLYKQLMHGLGTVAADQEIVCLGGETAELNSCVSSEAFDAKTKFNICAAMIGVGHPDKIITGETLAEGQVVMALWENGPGCNGISLIRQAGRTFFGNAPEFAEAWWHNPAAKEFIKLASQPCQLYDKFLLHLIGWTTINFKPLMKIHAIAHITGDGMPGKFGNDLLFPAGLSARLDQLFDVPPVLAQSAQWTGINSRELYKIFHGGQRALVVIDEEDVGEFKSRAQLFGITAKRCGLITKEAKPSLMINSRYLPERGQELIYESKLE